MANLRDTFTRKQWKDCCTKGCKKCRLARAYVAEYGRSDGLAALKSDRKAVLAAAKRDGKKAGKKKSGKRKKK